MGLLSITICLFAVALIDYTNTTTVEEEDEFFKAYGNGDGSKEGWKYINGCGDREFCKRFRGRSLPWLKSVSCANTRTVTILRQFKHPLDNGDVSEIKENVISCKMLKCDDDIESVVVIPLGTNRYCTLTRFSPVETMSDNTKFWLDKCYDMATGLKGRFISLKNWLSKCKNV